MATEVDFNVTITQLVIYNNFPVTPPKTAKNKEQCFHIALCLT